MLRGVGRCIGIFFYSRGLFFLEVQTASGQGYREEIALARSIYLAEASAPAFRWCPGLSSWPQRRFPQGERFSLYLLAPAIPRADKQQRV